MKCTQEGCDAPAEYRYAWPWGATGACCGEHVQHVKSHANQLQRELTLQPVPVQRDELANALLKVRDVAIDLRKRLESGAIEDPGTSSLGEELQRRIRNAPAPFGDTLTAIREVGTTLIGHAVRDLQVAQQREREAQGQVRELQRLLMLSEAQTGQVQQEYMQQVSLLRVQLEKAQNANAELEKQLDDPDPPPDTMPPGGESRVEGGELVGPAERELGQ